MKRLFLAIAGLTGLAMMAAPAEARHWSPYEPSANQVNRWSQASDPGYCLSGDYEICRAVQRSGFYGMYAGLQIFSGSGGYYFYDANRVRTNTWRRGGKWYKNCGNDPAIPIDEPCYVNRPEYRQGYAPAQQAAPFSSAASSVTVNDGCVTTEKYLPDGSHTVTRDCTKQAG
jgi:hypothetical protein